MTTKAPYFSPTDNHESKADGMWLSIEDMLSWGANLDEWMESAQDQAMVGVALKAVFSQRHQFICRWRFVLFLHGAWIDLYIGAQFHRLKYYRTTKPKLLKKLDCVRVFREKDFDDGNVGRFVSRITAQYGRGADGFMSTAENGDDFITFAVGGTDCTDVFSALTDSIHSYLKGRAGPVYWRVLPELRRHPVGWRWRCRLVAAGDNSPEALRAHKLIKAEGEPTIELH